MTQRIFYCFLLMLCGAGILVGVLHINEGQTARGLFTCLVGALLFATNAAVLRHEDEQ